jgi:hypothetical protein
MWGNREDRVALAEKIEVRYKGLLAKSGANRIYLHCGFGTDWRNVRDVAMNRDDDGTWRVMLELKDGSEVNFCFRDDAGNWDNNNGKNWGFVVDDSQLVSQ